MRARRRATAPHSAKHWPPRQFGPCRCGLQDAGEDARLPTLLIIPLVACILPGILVIVGGQAMLQLMASLADVGG